MKPRKQMSRKAYKMTLGLSYLISLILIALLVPILPSILWGIELKEIGDVYILLLGPFYLASVITFLVWAFLRLAISVVPLMEEERNLPLLQRLSYLQLFTCSGTAVIVIWTLCTKIIQSSVANTIFISGWDTVYIFMFHFLTIAFAAALLYAGACIKQIVITLLCFLLFIATIIGNVTGTIFILNKYYNPNEYCDGTYSDEDEYNESNDYEDIPKGLLMEEDTYEDITWTDSVGISVIHYCNEYGWNTSTDTTLCFIDRLLIDYRALREEQPDEDYAGDDDHRLDNKNWLNGKDCYRLYKLTTMILGQEPGERDNVYEILSEQVLPTILDKPYLYSAFQLESLVNMLDYAYYDLQSPENEKLESLYAEIASEKYMPLMAQLLPYFNQPYAMVHSNFDEVHLFWAYTFWARRWHDGHIGLCRQLLDKLLETFPNTTYTKETMEKAEQYYHEKRLERKHTPEDILKELEEAFADLPRPAKQTILINEMESEKQAKMGEILSRYTWQDIPQDILYECQDALSCFTPKGFQYYLPAFLMETVRNYNPESHLYPLLIQSLTYVRMSPEFGWRHFEPFSAKQQRTICHFLEWMAANYNDDFIDVSDGSSELWKAVESWWIRYDGIMHLEYPRIGTSLSPLQKVGLNSAVG